MVNLITHNQRRTLTTLYYTRLGTVTACAIGAAFAVSAILMLPTYFFIHSEADQAREYVTAASEIAATRAKGAAQETLAGFHETVKLLTAAHRPPSVAHILSLVSADLPRGVTLSAIDISHDAGGNALVRLTGAARTRAELIAYSAALKKIPDLTDVDVPVGALVADVNSSFTISVRWVRPQQP